MTRVGRVGRVKRVKRVCFEFLFVFCWIDGESEVVGREVCDADAQVS